MNNIILIEKLWALLITNPRTCFHCIILICVNSWGLLPSATEVLEISEYIHCAGKKSNDKPVNVIFYIWNICYYCCIYFKSSINIQLYPGLLSQVPDCGIIWVKFIFFTRNNYSVFWVFVFLFFCLFSFLFLMGRIKICNKLWCLMVL